jgi:hypothetical protein
MERKHLIGCLEKAFKIGCFRFHNLAALSIESRFASLDAKR